MQPSFDPLGGASSTRGLPLTASSQRAVAELLEGVLSRKGLLVLTGEVGTGKSTVLQQLRLKLAEKSVRTAFVFNPRLDTGNFFDFVLGELSVRRDPKAGADAFACLNDWLVARNREGASVALIIDEAQGLATPVIQALGFLVSQEVSGRKLLQVVLAGQPELNEKLRGHELRQIRQQIALRCRTSALNLEEAHSYMGQRFGTGDAPGFSGEAVEAAHFYAGGIPRVMNLLCEHALARARSHQIRPVPARMIEEAAREFQFDDARPLSPRRLDAGTGSADFVSRYPAGPELDQTASPNRDEEPLSQKAGALPAREAQGAPATVSMAATRVASVSNKPDWRSADPVFFAQSNDLAAAPGRLLSRYTMEPLVEFFSAAIDEGRRIWRGRARNSLSGRANGSLRFGGACRRAWISTLRWLKQPI